MTTAQRIISICLSPGLAVAQQVRWQVPTTGPSIIQYLWMDDFVDYNGDGVRDFVRGVQLDPSFWYATLQIASGIDGQTLWSLNSGNFRQPIACHAGDMDHDGSPDLAVLYEFGGTGREIAIVSPSTGAVIWRAFGTTSGQFGKAMLGNIDVTGDGEPDFVTMTSHTSESDVYVYNHDGTLLYTIPCRSVGRIAISLCNMHDIDGDGCEDFVVGCNEPTTRGSQLVVSGRTGTVLRESFGLLAGDKTSQHVGNLGDIDGDGINDYAAFAYWSAAREIAAAYSGATGAMIRSWVDYANSAVTGEDFDQDGVGDIVTGADWVIFPLTLYGWTWCHSGRDGSELWRLSNVPAPGAANGTSGWMEFSASLGQLPGSPYPVVAWLDINAWMPGTYSGRTRAYEMAFAGQGPVTGAACSSCGSLPLIGVRKLGTGTANTGFRTTVAKTHANALAALNFAFAPLAAPVDLTPFGYAGCTIYVDPLASFLRVTGSAGIDRGYAAVDLPHPLSTATTGTRVYAQWLVLEPSTAAFAATQVHAIRLP
jgi:hypothetical protein